MNFRWLDLWKEKNISFWGISTGNEPTNSYIAWNLIKIIDLGWDPVHQVNYRIIIMKTFQYQIFHLIIGKMDSRKFGTNNSEFCLQSHQNYI